MTNETLSRRQFITACAAVVPITSLVASAVVAQQAAKPDGEQAADKRGALGIVIHSYGIRSRHRPSRFDDPLAFLEYCRKLGAAGVQTSLGRRDEAFVGKIRDALSASGMYLEGIVGLPRDLGDVARFDDELRTAKDCG